MTWSNEFCGGIGKEGALIENGKGPWHSDVVLIKYMKNWGREDEDKRMVQS